MQLLQIISTIFSSHNKNISFCIAGKKFTYFFLQNRIATLQPALKHADVVGVSMDDDIDTYAIILATLFSGKTFVPLNPTNPTDRNQSIVNQAGIKLIFCAVEENSKEYKELTGTLVKNCKEFTSQSDEIVFETNVSSDDNAYILFTSGSTGVPKGVPIQRKNLDAFGEAFFALGYSLSEEDKFLQMFDLTFDLSIMSYLIPLALGASVYTVPFTGIKYTSIYLLLDEHEITFALMVPSIMQQLKPYFEEIRLEKMRYSLFCGEALYEDITQQWSACIPNAQIDNVYGPTEATIFCTRYTYLRNEKNKSNNGILSIGKAMHNNVCVAISEANEILPAYSKGELCLAGLQLTAGYLNNEEKNADSFFVAEINNTPTRLYRTGDICLFDNEGDIYYYGRKDNQVKIQGFRVELSEIDHHARKFLVNHAVVSVVAKNKSGNDVINLFVENFSDTTENLIAYLKTQMPVYMIPSEIISVEKFPLNTNGKVDRKALLNPDSINK